MQIISSVKCLTMALKAYTFWSIFLTWHHYTKLCILLIRTWGQKTSYNCTGWGALCYSVKLGSTIFSQHVQSGSAHMPMLSGTLLTINVLLDLEDLLEIIKLLITNHLIHDIVHQWLYQKKKKLVHLLWDAKKVLYRHHMKMH